MKYLLILLILFSCLFSGKAQKITDPRYKTFRPAKVQKVKLKKSKLSKEYRLHELSKHEKRKKAYKPGKKIDCNSPAYTNKSPLHYWKASQKINPKYFCNPNLN